MTISQHRKPKAFPCNSLLKKNSKRCKNNEVWRLVPFCRPPFLPRSHTCWDTVLLPRPARLHPGPSRLSDHPEHPHEMLPAPEAAPRQRRHHTAGTRGAASLSLSLGTCQAGGSQASASWDASHTVPSHGSSGTRPAAPGISRGTADVLLIPPQHQRDPPAVPGARQRGEEKLPRPRAPPEPQSLLSPPCARPLPLPPPERAGTSTVAAPTGKPLLTRHRRRSPRPRLAPPISHEVVNTLWQPLPRGGTEPAARSLCRLRGQRAPVPAPSPPRSRLGRWEQPGTPRLSPPAAAPLPPGPVPLAFVPRQLTGTAPASPSLPRSPGTPPGRCPESGARHSPRGSPRRGAPPVQHPAGQRRRTPDPGGAPGRGGAAHGRELGGGPAAGHGRERWGGAAGGAAGPVWFWGVLGAPCWQQGSLRWGNCN